MGNKEYLRGFIDAVEIALLELRRAKDLEDARRRLEKIYTLAVEHKIDQVARELGYPLMPG